MIRFRFDTYNVYGEEFANVRLWAGAEGESMKNCGILVFFTDEWFAFQTLLAQLRPTAVAAIEVSRVEEARRQLQLDLPYLPTDSTPMRPRDEETTS